MSRRINGLCASPIACLVLGVLFLASSTFSSDIAESIGTSSFDPVTQQELFEFPGSARSAPGVVASATASYLNITKRGSAWIGEKTPNHLVLDNGVAYVAGSYSGLLIYDVSDPLNPIEIAENHIPRYAVDIYKDGNTLAVVDTYVGIHLFDVTNPAAPTLIHTVPIEGSQARSVALMGDALYVAAEQGGLQTFDISIPTSPVLTSTIIKDSVLVTQVELIDGYAVIAFDYALTNYYAAPSRVWTFDLSNPTDPTVAGKLVLPGFVQFFDMTIDQGVAYLPSFQEGTYVVDVGSPDQPALLTEIPRGISAPLSVDVSNGVAYIGLATNLLIDVYDVSTPAAPVELGSYYSYEFGTATPDVAIMGNHVVVCAGSGGLQVLDAQDPANLSLVARNTVRGSARDIAVHGNYAYVANSVELSTVDVANPDDLHEQAEIPAVGSINAVMVTNNFLYYTEYSARVSKADLLDPADPTFVLGKSTQSYAKDIAVSGDYVFVADGAAGLSIYDFGFTPNPVLIGSTELIGDATAIALRDNTVFVSSGNVYLTVIDVTNPSSPQTLSQLPITGNAIGLYGDDILLVAGAYNDQTGLYILDISDPTMPYVIGEYALTAHFSRVFGVVVRNDLAFVASSRQVDIVDLSDPTMPAQAGLINTPYLARAIDISGDQFYIGGGGELQAYDVTVNSSACGDIDHSGGEPDVGDLTFVIGYLFLDGPRPVPSTAGDVDGVPGTDVGDVTRLVEFMFLDGPALSCQ